MLCHILLHSCILFLLLFQTLNLKRENSIVLNPAKLSNNSLRLAKDFFKNFGFKVIVLNSKTREQVIEILSKSKFYLLITI